MDNFKKTIHFNYLLHTYEVVYSSYFRQINFAVPCSLEQKKRNILLIWGNDIHFQIIVSNISTKLFAMFQRGNKAICIAKNCIFFYSVQPQPTFGNNLFVCDLFSAIYTQFDISETLCKARIENCTPGVQTHGLKGFILTSLVLSIYLRYHLPFCCLPLRKKVNKIPLQLVLVVLWK